MDLRGWKRKEHRGWMRRAPLPIPHTQRRCGPPNVSTNAERATIHPSARRTASPTAQQNHQRNQHPLQRPPQQHAGPGPPPRRPLPRRRQHATNQQPAELGGPGRSASPDGRWRNSWTSNCAWTHSTEQTYKTPRRIQLSARCGIAPHIQRAAQHQPLSRQMTRRR